MTRKILIKNKKILNAKATPIIVSAKNKAEFDKIIKDLKQNNLIIKK